MSGHVYPVIIKGAERQFWSVTSLIDLFSELGFFGDKVYYGKGDGKDIGSEGHDYIAQVLQYKPIDKETWDKLDERVKNTVRGLIRWQKVSHFKVKEIELDVHSERYCYAGRLDATGFAYSELTLIDWKTGILHEARLRMQLVLYLIAYLEMWPRRTIKRLRGVFFDKLTGDFTEYVIEMDEVTTILDQFLDFMSRIDVSMLADMAGTSELRQFRPKKLLGGKIMVTSSQALVKRQQERQLISQANSYNNAMEILKTWYPDADVPSQIKAAQIIWYHKVPPIKVFLIPFQNKTGTDWAVVMSIDAKRIIAQRGRALEYLDMTPRLMTEDEEIKVFKKADTSKVRAITHIRDVKTGSSAYGFGEISKGAKIQGQEKGNSIENMAMIRSESKALSRLPGVDVPDVDVVEENYQEPEYKEFQEAKVFDELDSNDTQKTVDAVSVPLREENKPVQPPLVEQKPAPVTNGKYAEMTKTCPVHGVKLFKDNYKNLQHKDGDSWCKLRKVIAGLIGDACLKRKMSSDDLNAFIKQQYGVTWSKLTDEQIVEVLKMVEEGALPLVETVSGDFNAQVFALVEKLEWTPVRLEQEISSFHGCKSLADFSIPQQATLLGRLYDLVAAKEGA